MGERTDSIFPFAIAVILPPAGLLLGLSQLKEDRGLAVRLLVVSVCAAVIWTLLLVR